MDMEQTELYERIQAFSLDDPEAELPFSQRLARDNGWSLPYAQQAIEEYKKFAFLAVVAGHPVTPSDQVDQVWHLHLAYTRSYWEDFCDQVLQMPLHHGPTLGGEAEAEKFDDWYGQTLESYERLFETTPIAAFWPAPEDRFGRDLHFVRTNTQQNWVLSKLEVQNTLTRVIPTLFTMGVCGGYLAFSAENNNLIAMVILVAIAGAATYGIVKMLTGMVDSIQNPSRRSVGIGYGGVGCGGAGCSGWGDSSWGDSSGDGGGCGGSGCGGGGCGGGGCGGCGG